jgi:hypothetical protein
MGGKWVMSCWLLNNDQNIIHFSHWPPSLSNIPTITQPVTICSSSPSLLPTALGTYLIRTMFDSLTMAF